MNLIHCSYTGHNNALFPRPEEKEASHPGNMRNVYDAMGYVLDNTPDVMKSKLVMGVASFGRGFVLTSHEDKGLYCSASGAIGSPGRTPGIWAYGQVSEALETQSYEKVMDDCVAAPYATNGETWISYDDMESLRRKVRYANSLEIGGIEMVSVECDDFTGDYSSSGPYPMLQVINAELTNGKFFDPGTVLKDCKGTAPSCFSEGSSPDHEKIVACWYGSWVNNR